MNDKEKEIEKVRFLNNANVLLISERQEEYDELVKYGFKNIDYFKSLVIADQYFKLHPERLYKYHLILTGKSSIHNCCFHDCVDLEFKIREIKNKTGIMKASLSKYEFSDRIEIIAYCNTNRNFPNPLKSNGYDKIFNYLVDYAAVTEVLDNAQVMINVPKYSEYVNKKRLLLPYKKENIKILYLDSVMVNKYAEDIARKLGLPIYFGIDFKEDDNNALGLSKDKLGEYDIIIASDLYSSNLLNMNIESNEQCKKTGRDLTLLLTYKTNSLSQFTEDDELDVYGLGNKINLKYIFSGPLAHNNSSIEKKTFNSLRKHFEFIPEDDERILFFEESTSDMAAIISSAINIYNSKLMELDKVSIRNNDLMSADDFDKEYKIAEDKEMERKRIALAPIEAFDSIKGTIAHYLKLKKEGVITKKPVDINVIESKHGIRLENIYQKNIMCVLTYRKSNEKGNLRVFEIQTLSKKGKLSNPKMVGLYTQKYENSQYIPDRPDEKQYNALESIRKKVNTSICPLIYEGWDKRRKKNNGKVKKK